MKNARQKAIREIIESKNIVKQLQLTEELKERGFHVTQATISRDIKEMGILKISVDGKNFRYSFSPGLFAGSSMERTRRLFQEDVLSISASENLLVIRTLPGTANGIASCLDSLKLNSILGCVAGDDTILAVVNGKEETPAVMETLQKIIK